MKISLFASPGRNLYKGPEVMRNLCISLFPGLGINTLAETVDNKNSFGAKTAMLNGNWIVGCYNPFFIPDQTEV